MQHIEAISVLKTLIDGRVPGSEESLPDESVIHRADVLRALLAAVAALERAAERAQRRALLPDNVGRSWTGEEESELIEAFKAGDSPELIARKHRRTLRAVEARLERIGLLKPEDRITRGGFPSPA